MERTLNYYKDNYSICFSSQKIVITGKRMKIREWEKMKIIKNKQTKKEVAYNAKEFLQIMRFLHGCL